MPILTGEEGGAGFQESAPARRVAAILAAPQSNDQAMWQAFHSIEGYDATNAVGILCSGGMAGAFSRLTEGQRIPLACSDGKIAILQVTELTPRGARALLTIDKIQQSASIVDTVEAP